jgi:hypothetical protein
MSSDKVRPRAQFNKPPQVDEIKVTVAIIAGREEERIGNGR